MSSYKTIEGVAQGEYREKGSKFFAFAHCVNSIEEAKALNKQYRKEYYDARHHCFAYIIDPENPITRAADDGEPSNSAGNPILGQIKSFGLTNVMIMVVRYFGGTKLGVPGLIRSYKMAAQDALGNATIVEKKIQATFSIHFGYESMDVVMQIIKKYEVDMKSQKIELSCEMTLSVNKDNFLEVLQQLEKKWVKIKN